jgi:hypothetical protein
VERRGRMTESGKLVCENVGRNEKMLKRLERGTGKRGRRKGGR